MKQTKKQIPPQSILVYIDDELKSEIKEFARSRKLSSSSWCRVALFDKLREEQTN